MASSDALPETALGTSLLAKIVAMIPLTKRINTKSLASRSGFMSSPLPISRPLLPPPAYANNLYNIKKIVKYNYGPLLLGSSRWSLFFCKRKSPSRLDGLWPKRVWASKGDESRLRWQMMLGTKFRLQTRQCSFTNQANGCRITPAGWV